LLGLLDPESEDTVVLQNARSYSPSDMASDLNFVLVLLLILVVEKP
jgi:hypothetical protein